MDESKHFNKGLEYYNQGRFSGANLKFKAALKKDPSHIKAWLYNAMTLHELGRYEKAYECIEKAHALDPQSIDICLELIRILLKIGTYEELLEFCENNQKLNPRIFKLKLIEIHEHFRQYGLAMEKVNDLLMDNPEDSYLLRLKDFLLQAKENSGNYYIPVIQSGLLSHLPLGEEIIYSSHVKISWSFPVIYKDLFPEIWHRDDEIIGFIFLLAGGITAAVRAEKRAKERSAAKGETLTDALMTNEGIYIMKPTFEKKNTSTQAQFIPWNTLKVDKYGDMIFEDYFKCEFHHLPLYESESLFTSRKQGFLDFITAKRYHYTRKCLERLRTHINDMNDEKARECFERGYRSNLWHSDYNLGKELAEVFAPAKIRLRKSVKTISDKSENLIFAYLNSNKGQAFTLKSLERRLSQKVKDPLIAKHLKHHLEGILNRLVHIGKIELDHHSGTMFYHVNINRENLVKDAQVKNLETIQGELDQNPDDIKPALTTRKFEDEAIKSASIDNVHEDDKLERAEIDIQKISKEKALPKKTEEKTPEIKEGICSVCSGEEKLKTMICPQCGRILWKRV